jgi:hypothetical protein
MVKETKYGPATEVNLNILHLIYKFNNRTTAYTREHFGVQLTFFWHVEHFTNTSWSGSVGCQGEEILIIDVDGLSSFSVKSMNVHQVLVP